mmetsp:Transcript_9412/g.23200  ORF Transcript_9412/g.23200 Transcript_9412/m.23200 type:complete len:254 (-) Transcript_9412:531-1292(-)
MGVDGQRPSIFPFFQARYQACGAMSSDLVRLARCLHDPSIRLHLHATQVSGETGSRANCRLYGVVQLLLGRARFGADVLEETDDGVTRKLDDVAPVRLHSTDDQVEVGVDALRQKLDAAGAFLGKPLGELCEARDVRHKHCAREDVPLRPAFGFPHHHRALLPHSDQGHHLLLEIVRYERREMHSELRVGLLAPPRASHGGLHQPDPGIGWGGFLLLRYWDRHGKRRFRLHSDGGRGDGGRGDRPWLRAHPLV